MLRALTAMALALALSTPAAADVLVELSPGPLPELDRSTVTVRDDGGIVGVSHRAENRFSIGARAFCDD